MDSTKDSPHNDTGSISESASHRWKEYSLLLRPPHHKDQMELRTTISTNPPEETARNSVDSNTLDAKKTSGHHQIEPRAQETINSAANSTTLEAKSSTLATSTIEASALVTNTIEELGPPILQPLGPPIKQPRGGKSNFKAGPVFKGILGLGMRSKTRADINEGQ